MKLLNSVSTQRRSFAAFAALVVFTSLMATAQTEAVIHAFQSTKKYDGLGPSWNGLVPDPSGALYGATTQGGANGFGAVYKLSPPAQAGGTWNENVLYSFKGTGADGKNPQGNLLLVGKKIYGTTQQGGASGNGIVYELDPPAQAGGAWTETVIYTFTGGADGKDPVAGLILGKRGVLYGTATNGGDANGDGVVFGLIPPASAGGTWTQHVLHAFQGGSDGREPIAALVSDSSGALYGVTYQSGQYGFGGVYKLTPPASGSGPWSNTVLYAFQDGNDGGGPICTLVFDHAGALYGTTADFTQTTKGTAFQLVPPSGGSGSWTLNTLFAFQDGNDGGFPSSGVIFDTSGALYGNTTQGGSTGLGAAFKLTPPSSGSGAWIETVLHTFSGGTDGIFPYAPLVLVGSTLYGTTNGGGVANAGTAFQITP